MLVGTDIGAVDTGAVVGDEVGRGVLGDLLGLIVERVRVGAAVGMLRN